jgi:hypothetical protein
MKIKDMTGTILRDAPDLGTFTLPDLLQFVSRRSISGIAVAKENGREYYLAILSGEPEGAIYNDEDGTLFGDKAVMQITGHETFVLHDVKPEIVTAMVMGCRIFELGHLAKTITGGITEIGKKRSGIGLLTLTIRHDAVPLNGVRVSIRSEGRIVGSDITTRDGTVSFRMLYGAYDCIVQDRNLGITTVPLQFDESDSRIIVEL